MAQCSKCGANSTGSSQFCTQCGSAISASTPTSFAGRPVIPMDPRKQGQSSESPSQVFKQVTHQPVVSNQNLNSQVPQSQFLPSSLNSNSQAKSRNKVVFGVVGVLIAIVALVFLLGQKDSNSPNVAPNNQQSGSDSEESSNEPAQSSYSYEDYPSTFRSEFLDSCFVEGTYEACVCSLENMESLYSYSEVLEIANSNSDLSWFYQEIIAGCL